MKGRLEVICGPMFSGKTEELARRVRRHLIAKQTVKAYKPSIDNRYGARSEIVSHIGNTVPATTVDTRYTDNIYLLSRSFDIAAIDEVQFFDSGIVKNIKNLVDEGIIVIVSGLDQDFRGDPFGHMPELLAMADMVVKLKAVCNSCGADANMTQRLIDGKPAPYSGDTILVGAKDSYEARCRNCHERG